MNTDLPRSRDGTPAFDAAALTAVLRQGGFLTDGAVTRIRVGGTLHTSISHIKRLQVDYDISAAEQGAPRRLLAKIAVDAGNAAAAARREAQFYTDIAPRLSHPHLARCYGTGERNGLPFLLLEDLSESHASREWPLPLADTHCEAAVGALAKIHAWGRLNPHQLGPAVLAGEDALKEAMEKLDARHHRFSNAFSDILNAEQRQAFTTVLRSGGKPWRATARGEGLVLIHGDAHCGNVLYPRSPGEPEVILIDWQYWARDSGARDLAYLMALHWNSDRRSRLEVPLLQHYHRCLQQAGAGDYSWDQCREDYRLAAARNLLVPEMLWERGVPAARWWPLLQCALQAYRDLECAELL